MEKILVQFLFLFLLLLNPILVNGQDKLSMEKARQNAFEAAMKARSQFDKQKKEYDPQDNISPISSDWSSNHQINFLQEFEPQTDYLNGNATIAGKILNDQGEPLTFANVVLYDNATNEIVKAAITQSNGIFEIDNLIDGTYYYVVSYIGLSDLNSPKINLSNGQKFISDQLQFGPPGMDLITAEVVASRPIFEVKPDRVTFNISETINSTGSDGLSLLRKAPSVMVDHNNSIRIDGRPGVTVYIDGRPSPLSGEQLTFYLQSLSAEQIDKIDIISNPGPQYEAQGSAGIIDIILKQNVDHGTNGSISNTVAIGQRVRYNLNAMLNRRTKRFNFFGNGGFGKAPDVNTIEGSSIQQDVIMNFNGINQDVKRFKNFRLGTDFFLSQKHTLGFVVDQFYLKGDNTDENQTTISNRISPESVDSVLLVNTKDSISAKHRQYNFNYKFSNPDKAIVWKINANFGRFKNTKFRNQPNLYINPSSGNLLSENNNQQDFPSTIKLSSIKFDNERSLDKNQLNFGAKIGSIQTDNVFSIQSDAFEPDSAIVYSAQQFVYRELTYALYGNYVGNIFKKINYDFGLRTEFTQANGESPLVDSTVRYHYFNLFPNLTLAYEINPELNVHTHFSRRIRRPDFTALNPFQSRINDLAYEQGNPILSPEIVNKAELGLTIKYRYNIKLTYSQTTDQITPFNTPDDTDERAGLSSWNNIKRQRQWSLNFSAPVEITKWWDSFNTFNLNQMSYVSSFENNFSNINSKIASVMFFHQSSFKAPFNLNMDLSFWYQGNGIWNGVFEHDSIWEMNIGVGRSFMNDQLNVQLSISDIFYSTGSSGQSNFSGRFSTMLANRDSRRVGLSISYFFGRQNDPMVNMFQIQEEKTGQEVDASRVESQNNIY